MRKHFLSISALTGVALAVSFSWASALDSSKEAAKQKRMEEILKSLPDSVFENCKVEDLLDDEVYLKLAKDGWSAREITTIMETAVKDKQKARNRASYGAYAKEWRPAFGRAMSDDPLYQVRDSALTPKTIASIYEAVGENTYNAIWKKVVYDPTLRKQPGYKGTPGYFRAAELNPSAGRMKWITVNQDNEKGDELYVLADGAGIFRTRDCGKTWDCISDNIPDRANRGIAAEYSIPVDPTDWNHIVALMQNNTVYETFDGGDSWEKVPGGNYLNKNFKRGYAFRAKPRAELGETEGQFILIGAAMNNSNRMYNELWLSYDKGVTWNQLGATAALNQNNDVRETVNISGTNYTGFWFQQMAFDPKNPDRVYFPGCRSILYFDDAGRSKTLKRLTFNVYGKDKTELRAANTFRFPFPGNAAGHMEIDPNNPDRMWFCVGNSSANYTALYYSDDHGANWITLHEPHKVTDANPSDNWISNLSWDSQPYIGSGTVFGNETANVWLGGFGIEYNSSDPEAVPTNFFGCSMSSAYSFDGGHNWTEYAWGYRQHSLLEEGNLVGGPGYYYVSASRHNADNHCIASHKSGRVFRASDGGMFMHDPKISGHVTVNNSLNSTQNMSTLGQADWINIGSNMGEMLFYNVRVNEFGDQAIIGNTQDIDVQTYRYGRWGHWRGYEGTEASFNPYTGTGYFSSGGNAPEGMKPDSWHTARNFADVVTGSWFMLRTWNGSVTPSTLFRVDDIGRSLTDLYSVIGKTVTDVGLCRKDKDGNEKLTVFIRTSGDNAFWVSTDSCKTFKALTAYNGKPAAFSDSKLAVDPEHDDFFYFGQNGGKVYKYDLTTANWTTVGNGLPTNIKCSRLLFHEGSGDLYYVDYSSGIYILKNGESTWRFWTRGYNPAGFRDCDINYTTQEFVLADYGRGVWVADLETPSDRYFKDNFELQEISHRDGRRTFGIKTKWQIPMYYNFKWFVNYQEVKDYNYQYLTVDENTPLVVQLEISLREAPNVKSTSAVFTVDRNTPNMAINRHQGNALYSNGEGRVDIGYMDWFDGDFTVDLWVKPQSDGVILANTQKDVDKGAKGWLLYIESGVLKFKYYPSNVLQQPTYEPAITQNAIVTGNGLAMNKWQHVAVVQERHGSIRLYINGQEVGNSTRIRSDEPHGLNNSVIMSLFGDAFESSTLKGAVDELKVWNRALKIDDIRREMFSTGLATDGLMAHYDFNGEALAENVETFTGYKPLSRQRAVTSAQRQTVPVSADYVADGNLTGNDKFVSKVGENISLMGIEGNNLQGTHTIVYGYKAGRWENSDDNLSEEYYTPTDYGYMFRTFGLADPDATADIRFFNGSGQFTKDRKYRLYTADNSEDRMYWKQYDGELVYDQGALKISNARLNDLSDRKLLVVTMKPAIELTLDGLGSDGRITIYDDSKAAPRYPFTARLIEGMTLSKNSYEIMSDSTVLIVPETPLSFNSSGEAHGNIGVDIDLIGPFNNTISTYLRGKDDESMIPIPIDVLNRITPKSLNNPVEIVKGCLRVGSPADYAALKGSNHATIMGWVRVDDVPSLVKGRNGDGYAPLIFFRSASGDYNAAGIHMYKGNLGYHWTDRGWDFRATTPSSFTLTEADQGKWFHVALVIRPDGATMYFNGTEYKMSGTPNPMPGFVASSPILLGTNTQGNYSYFSGAFDHVAIWNRSLSREEIHKYMHNRVLLNDPDLLSYITFDDTDDTGKYVDVASGAASTNHFGTVSKGFATPVPFAPYREDQNMGVAGCPITLSNTTDGCVASFEGTPYNYLSTGTEYQEYLPLNHEYYTLVFNTVQNPGSNNITLTYTNEGLVDGEEVAVGIREIGSVNPFAQYFKSTAVGNKKATFSVPATALAKSSEIMFFSTPSSSHRPNIVRMSFANPSIENGGIVLLGDGENTIDIDVNVISGNDRGVELIVLEEEYAKLSKTEIDMEDAEQKVTLTIDRSKLREINPTGLSDITILMAGTTNDDILTLQVGLKPRVELSLKNGTDASHFKATKAVSTLDIEAKLVEGYLTDKIQLNVTPSTLSSSLNLANGSLLLNEDVSIAGLSKGRSPGGDYAQGWNLIGNPYLTDINLTKVQNFGEISDKITHFVYHTLEGSDNIIAFDMTDYDAEEHINPFQPFYVQALTDETDFTVKTVAKEKKLDRKTFDYYTANEVRNVQIQLLDANGKEVDRTAIRWDDQSNNQYVLNEDAPKVVSANAGNSTSLYSLSQDGRQLSINVMPNKSKQLIKLGLDVASPSQMTLKVSRLSGFDGTENNLYLVDFGGGEKHIPLTEGLEYPVTLDGEGPLEDRFLIVPTLNGDVMTDNDDALTDGMDGSDYRVYTDKRSITVTGLQGDAQVNIYNVSGMLLIRIETSDATYSTEIEQGVYIVRIRENDKDYVTKVVVK